MTMLKLRSLLSVFNRGHAIFAGGTAASMLFPLVSAPILSRLYSPADFGVYAVYFAIATILTVVSSLCMQNAITLEDDAEGQFQALVLACGLTTVFSASVAAIVVGCSASCRAAIGLSTDTRVEAWLPVTVWLGGLSAAFYAWATKNQRYRALGHNKVILAGLTAALQIGIGVGKPGAIGFVIANIIGLATSLILLIRIFHSSNAFNLKRICWPSLTLKFRRHYKLALWTLPATLVNAASTNLPDLLIGRFFGASQLGQYSLANRMFSMPLSFVTTSAQDFFRQQASDEFAKNGHCKKTFKRFILLLIAFSVLIIAPILLVVPYIFPLIFGAQWDSAGRLVQCLAFLLIMRFVSSPISYVWFIAGRQKEDFYWQIVLIIISASTFFLPLIIFPSISLERVLICYSVVVGAWYLFQIVQSKRFADGR